MEQPAALRAGDHRFFGAKFQACLRSDFHVATRAHIMVDGYNCARIFRFKQALVAIKKFLIDSLKSS